MHESDFLRVILGKEMLKTTLDFQIFLDGQGFFYIMGDPVFFAIVNLVKRIDQGVDRQSGDFSTSIIRKILAYTAGGMKMDISRALDG